MIKTKYSVISSGTEIATLISSGESLLQKAKKQPEQLKKVLAEIKNQGIIDTVKKVSLKLDLEKPTGYSCSGVVIDIGKGVKDFKIGDFVACAGNAYHAEIVCVPRNLVVKVPENLNLDSAASVALGAIAMQGVRRAESTIGELVAVIGTGLIGLLTIQILKAMSCKIIAIDIDENKLKKSAELGADYIININTEDIIKKIQYISEFNGVDSVIITASTKSSDVVQKAMEIVRKRGKVVVVGDVGMNLKRKPFYEKEADFLISCSYGPGRYDENYEELGCDYPIGFVRWTENRNMKAYLELLASEKVNFSKLVSKIFPLEKAKEAFDYLKENKESIACLLKYDDNDKLKESKIININSFIKSNKSLINLAVIGAGSFALNTHLPNLKALKDIFHIRAIVSREGYKAKSIAKKFGAEYCTTDYSEVLKDSNIDMVLICTRHNLHAKMAIDALNSGKAVFLEKPMAMNEDELSVLENTIIKTKLPFMVGFNRRYSKHATFVKEILERRSSPLVISYRVNSGMVPINHWTRTEEGGGRIIGEACHMIDLILFFVGYDIQSIKSTALKNIKIPALQKDNFISVFKFSDGSIANLIYSSIGSEKLNKEKIEIFIDGKSIVIDDFKSTFLYSNKIQKFVSRKIEKGYLEELKEFGELIKNGYNNKIILKDMLQATRASFIIDSQLDSDI